MLMQYSSYHISVLWLIVWCVHYNKSAVRIPESFSLSFEYSSWQPRTHLNSSREVIKSQDFTMSMFLIYILWPVHGTIEDVCQTIFPWTLSRMMVKIVLLNLMMGLKQLEINKLVILISILAGNLNAGSYLIVAVIQSKFIQASNPSCLIIKLN